MIGIKVFIIINPYQKMIWIKVFQMFELDPYLNSFSSIWLNPKLCINKSLFLWKDWQGKRIATQGDLYHSGILKSFNDLLQGASAV